MLLGLVAVAALPAAIAVAQLSEQIELLDAAVGIPVAGLAGIAAVWLARRARQQIERTLGRVGGLGAARAGRALGALGICLALAGAIAVATYAVLEALSE